MLTQGQQYNAAYYQVKLGSDDISRPITLIVAGKDDNATVER